MSSPLDLSSVATVAKFEEDFISNDSVADALLGSNRMELVTIANASTLAYQTAAPAVGINGVLRFTTAATADGDGAVLRTKEDGLVVRPGTTIVARFRLVTDVLSSLRIGLDDSVTATEPTVGVWLNVAQGVVSCQVDSADHGDESALVVGHPDLTSGTTLVAGTWYDMEIVCSGQQNAQGGPKDVVFGLAPVAATGKRHIRRVAVVPCNIDDDEEVEIKFAHWQASGGASAKIAEIDFIGVYIPR